jgi:TolB-like protein/DNA-binding SARP family transcriptional activator
VGTAAETTRRRPDGTLSRLTLRLLGGLAVMRDGVAVGIPPSRKVRALLAYLALSAAPVSRSHICDLLWDVANDPRGELRWCLSRLRGLLNAPDRDRIRASDDLLSLDLEGCSIDAHAVESGVQRLDAIDIETLQDLARLSSGEFMAGLVIDRCPQFNTWLMAQQRRFEGHRASILRRLSELLPSERALPFIEQWVEIAPFDVHAQSVLFDGLAKLGRLAEGDKHLASATKMFADEGLDFAPLRAAWSVARAGRHTARAVAATPPETVAPRGPTRASLAVMPFSARQDDALPGGLAAGLTHDIISRLAKLRHFFVIAEGSVVTLAEQHVGTKEAGHKLKVDYIARGSLRRHAGRIVIVADLIETRTGRLIWSENYDRGIDDLFAVLNEIGDAIVSAIAAEVETVERNCALLKLPGSLNAWEAYHRGLWHAYRFTKEDNATARHFFEMSVNLDPTFARAHAGLSFTHWQSAFQNWEDRELQIHRAYETAGQSLIVDDRDPVAHWAMGRVLWLRGRNDESLSELQSAVDISPNFALGHYALSFVHAQSGDPQAAIAASDQSRRLSPFDPLLFGMLGTKAIALVRLGEYESAAEWAVKAAARPNAHATILAIAAHCLALAGRLEEARSFAAAIRKTRPDYQAEDFLSTFHFTPDLAALFRKGGRQLGLH